ncbi:hypothetical protein LZ32DRAFT_13800 [Colletotrichum eremochloae]|nr:hypothetical protein LZ32DRAFT_13800 [Colletotrichum eremochloae]
MHSSTSYVIQVGGGSLRQTWLFHRSEWLSARRTTCKLDSSPPRLMRVYVCMCVVATSLVTIRALVRTTKRITHSNVLFTPCTVGGHGRSSFIIARYRVGLTTRGRNRAHITSTRAPFGPSNNGLLHDLFPESSISRGSLPWTLNPTKLMTLGA